LGEIFENDGWLEVSFSLEVGRHRRWVVVVVAAAVVFFSRLFYDKKDKT
jgi:hypothetical protein